MTLYLGPSRVAIGWNSYAAGPHNPAEPLYCYEDVCRHFVQSVSYFYDPTSYNADRPVLAVSVTDWNGIGFGVYSGQPVKVGPMPPAARYIDDFPTPGSPSIYPLSYIMTWRGENRESPFSRGQVLVATRWDAGLGYGWYRWTNRPRTSTASGPVFWERMTEFD